MYDDQESSVIGEGPQLGWKHSQRCTCTKDRIVLGPGRWALIGSRHASCLAASPVDRVASVKVCRQEFCPICFFLRSFSSSSLVLVPDSSSFSYSILFLTVWVLDLVSPRPSVRLSPCLLFARRPIRDYSFHDYSLVPPSCFIFRSPTTSHPCPRSFSFNVKINL